MASTDRETDMGTAPMCGRGAAPDSPADAAARGFADLAGLALIR
jgi:hypothetical protein